ncbi:MAG: sigma-54 dependent transcriptional regulator [Nitrospiraceae bacterium]|nr:sigma-54 dependent transcriptional regulator [Nitrospiraceae bacterium]
MANGNPMKKTFLVIDDDRVFANTVRDYLSSDAVEVMVANSAMDGLAACQQRKIDVVLLDQQLPDAEGHTLCAAILKSNDQAKIIFSTAFPSFENAVKAIRSGASDYLSKPYDLEELSLAVRQAFRTLELENVEQIQDYQRTRESEQTVVIGGEGLAETMKMVDLAATTDSPVLITGETGAGKTLVAKAIHYKGRALKAPFISINCASLPENLIEAELFGYEKGAFTGAAAARKGLFEMAEGGTLFLDEIGEMPIHLQAKLLSAIEEKNLRRLGSESVRPVNVRIIAATGINLEDFLGQTFRKDLYYRLSVIRMHIPPLRERRSDIPMLCRHLLKALADGHEVELSDAELDNLARYDWPGNVRELKNILERAYLLQRGSEFRPSELLGQTTRKTALAALAAENAEPGAPILPLDEVEMRHIQFVLGRCSGNYTQTAKALGISLSTLKRKLKSSD